MLLLEILIYALMVDLMRFQSKLSCHCEERERRGNLLMSKNK